jgi:hypothetical protein
VGVAGSNPATPTRYSLVALNFHKYLQLLRRARSYLREAVDCYNAGLYRAAIVTTWVAVVFDLIEKIRELALSGDQDLCSGGADL